MTSLRGDGPAKIRSVLISQEAFLNSLCSDMVPCIQFSEASICRTLMYYFFSRSCCDVGIVKVQLYSDRNIAEVVWGPRLSGGAICMCGGVLKTLVSLISICIIISLVDHRELLLRHFYWWRSCSLNVLWPLAHRVSFNPCSWLRNIISSVILAKIDLKSVFVGC